MAAIQSFRARVLFTTVQHTCLTWFLQTPASSWSNQADHYLRQILVESCLQCSIGCLFVRGYFTVGNVSYHIDPVGEQLNGPHRVYRGRGDSKTLYRCGEYLTIR